MRFVIQISVRELTSFTIFERRNCDVVSVGMQRTHYLQIINFNLSTYTRFANVAQKFRVPRGEGEGVVFINL